MAKKSWNYRFLILSNTSQIPVKIIRWNRGKKMATIEYTDGKRTVCVKAILKALPGAKEAFIMSKVLED